MQTNQLSVSQVTSTLMVYPTVKKLNIGWHERALWGFAAIVLAHWVEHVAQAWQIWIMGWPVADAKGVLGFWFPGLVESEALHFGYAVVMLAGFICLRPGFHGRSGLWWSAALLIQVWHWIEHALLQGQAITGTNLLGADKPTSVVQLWVPRVELHLLYNLAVTLPMVVAILLHSSQSESPDNDCTCAT